MFELTGTLNYIVPCMVTLMVAKLVGDAFGHGGIAEHLIRMNNYPFLDPREDMILGVTAGEVMTRVGSIVSFTNRGMCIADVGMLAPFC